MWNEKDAKSEVKKVRSSEGALTDDDLESVTGGALPKWWLDGAAEALKKSNPDKVC